MQLRFSTISCHDEYCVGIPNTFAPFNRPWLITLQTVVFLQNNKVFCTSNNSTSWVVVKALPLQDVNWKKGTKNSFGVLRNFQLKMIRSFCWAILLDSNAKILIPNARCPAAVPSFNSSLDLCSSHLVKRSDCLFARKLVIALHSTRPSGRNPRGIVAILVIYWTCATLIDGKLGKSNELVYKAQTRC